MEPIKVKTAEDMIQELAHLMRLLPEEDSKLAAMNFLGYVACMQQMNGHERVSA